ncbi:MAG: type II secretion system F family protein [Nitrosopumilus sp.]|nr:type II secretion system F family protein [Nitrosopumilus sp.]MBA3550791.1 type II secretion system F family protein [Patescibacteria group bacterium]
MLFNYKAIDNTGAEREGSIEAINVDVAINSLQRRGLVISSIKTPDQRSTLLQKNFTFFEHVTNKEIVILSRQLAILFEAQVSALRVFRLIASEADNPLLRKSLTEVSDDLQGGNSISKSLSKHPKMFSNFYVNMVRAGEESGKLNEAFAYLADYLDRNYEVTSKARNALIYPAFVVFTFIAVMILMFTIVIPKISLIITESGQEIPIYTKVVLGISNFLVSYGIFLLPILLIAAFFLIRYIRTPQGKESFDHFKLSVPYVGMLYHKLYLSRITDNMNTMLISGIPMIKSLEITGNVVGNSVYEKILNHSVESVKGGSSLSDSFVQYSEIPGILIQMIKVGEESGELGNILKTMAKFYQREVINAVDTLVDLIEPVMIVLLGAGVGILLASVLVPIYNLASAF